VFTVPLSRGRHAIGLIARCPPGKKVLYGYFFDPYLPGMPSSSNLDLLRAPSAVLVKFFSDMKLLSGAWPIAGVLVRWRRSDWPVRQFVRKDLISGELFKVTYADDGSNREIAARPCGVEESIGLHDDGVAGASALEAILDRLVSGPPRAVH
jgi:hypothetical protein